MRDTFARVIYEMGKEDPRVFVVVADISPGGGMEAFRDEFPERFVNVGVAEQSMIGLCAGLALRGCIPFAYTIATFAAYRAFEMVRDDLCYQNLPVTVVGIGGGVNYSTLGGTHHAQEDVAVMSAIPNMSLVAPCDPLETEEATWACYRLPGPAYLRLGRAGEPVLTADAADGFAFGKLRYLRKGRDTCIVSYGPIMKMAFEVAAGLERTGESVSLVSAHTLKPLDTVGIADVLVRHRRVVVIEEHSPNGGLVGRVYQAAWEARSTCEIQAFTLRDEFIHAFGSHVDLLRAHGLDPQLIVDALKS